MDRLRHYTPSSAVYLVPGIAHFDFYSQITITLKHVIISFNYNYKLQYNTVRDIGNIYVPYQNLEVLEQPQATSCLCL